VVDGGCEVCLETTETQDARLEDSRKDGKTNITDDGFMLWSGILRLQVLGLFQIWKSEALESK
jgi:hypothetical protein